jgi:hypothetical protein
MAEIAVVLIAMLLRWREDMLRIEAEVMQHETCSDGDEECKDQKSDKSLIHVIPPGPIQFLYDTSWRWLNVRPRRRERIGPGSAPRQTTAHERAGTTPLGMKK